MELQRAWGTFYNCTTERVIEALSPRFGLLCETKQSTSFVKNTIKKLHLDNRWQVSEPDGRKKGMLVAWSQRVEIKHRWTNEFVWN